MSIFVCYIMLLSNIKKYLGHVSKAIGFKNELICLYDYLTNKSFAPAEIEWNYEKVGTRYIYNSYVDTKLTS